MNDSRWQIDYQCPQCGAPVILDETDRLLSCPYCRTKLYLVKEDGFHYLIPHDETAGREIYYLPYWRVKGSRFCFRDLQVQFRFVDISQKAIPLPMIPLSLGVRPQAMKLRFLTPESSGIFLAPQGKALESVFPAGEKGEKDGGDFIGEVTSLIYTPVFMEGKTLYDAVTNRRLNDLPDPDLLTNLPRTDPVKSAKILFLPTLCPQCGWNLDGEKDALTLCCPNCHTLWQCRKDRLEILDFSIVASPSPPDLYLPFWKMKIAAGGFCLDSIGDLIRLANLPKVTTSALESTPLYFWSPAFKINPALYLRWTRQMTVSQPTVKKEPNPESFSSQPLHPVTLPLSEAVEGVRMNIGQLLSDKRRLLPALAGTTITLLEAELVYQPFRRQNSELIHTTLGLTVDRNALSLAVHLS
jgi:DNA-directed RNA polymerase subunit RPC12/RpoP